MDLITTEGITCVPLSTLLDEISRRLKWGGEQPYSWKPTGEELKTIQRCGYAYLVEELSVRLEKAMSEDEDGPARLYRISTDDLVDELKRRINH